MLQQFGQILSRLDCNGIGLIAVTENLSPALSLCNHDCRSGSVYAQRSCRHNLRGEAEGKAGNSVRHSREARPASMGSPSFVRAQGDEGDEELAEWKASAMGTSYLRLFLRAASAASTAFLLTHFTSEGNSPTSLGNVFNVGGSSI